MLLTFHNLWFFFSFKNTFCIQFTNEKAEWKTKRHQWNLQIKQMILYIQRDLVEVENSYIPNDRAFIHKSSSLRLPCRSEFVWFLQQIRIYGACCSDWISSTTQAADEDLYHMRYNNFTPCHHTTPEWNN